MSVNIENKCPHCEKGWQPVLLDEDGVLTSISGKIGKMSHAFDDYWWDCPNACQCSANVHKVYCCDGLTDCEFIADFCVHCNRHRLESADAVDFNSSATSKDGGILERFG